MNKERMLKLANFIEKLPAHKFDMTNWAIDQANTEMMIDCKAMNPHQCKTTGCIAGWAIFLFAEREPFVYDKCGGLLPWRSPPVEAELLLELNEDQVQDLFYGHGFEVDLTNITRDMAAKLIRDMVANNPD
jgi:hypothetical protein